MSSGSTLTSRPSPCLPYFCVQTSSHLCSVLTSHDVNAAPLLVILCCLMHEKSKSVAAQWRHNHLWAGYKVTERRWQRSEQHFNKCVREIPSLKVGGRLKQGLSTRHSCLHVACIQCSVQHAPNISFTFGGIWNFFLKEVFSSMLGIPRCGTYRCEERIVI